MTPVKTLLDVDQFFLQSSLSQRGIALTDIDDPSTEPLTPPKRNNKSADETLMDSQVKSLVLQKGQEKERRSVDEDDDTVVTSDQSIKERFIQDTAYLMEQLSASPTSKQSKVSAETNGNTSGSSISLIELVSRVQKLCKWKFLMLVSIPTLAYALTYNLSVYQLRRFNGKVFD
jgi:hypothetical protein